MTSYMSTERTQRLKDTSSQWSCVTESWLERQTVSDVKWQSHDTEQPDTSTCQTDTRTDGTNEYLYLPTAEVTIQYNKATKGCMIRLKILKTKQNSTTKSQYGTVSNRLNVSFKFFHHLIAPSSSSIQNNYTNCIRRKHIIMHRK